MRDVGRESVTEVPRASVTTPPPAFRDVAGVDLCKRLIWALSLIAGVVLIGSLVAEFRNAARAASAQERVLASISGLHATSLTPVRIAEAIAALERLRAQAQAGVAADAASRAAKAVPGAAGAGAADQSSDPVSQQVDLGILLQTIFHAADSATGDIERDGWMSHVGGLRAAQQDAAQLGKIPAVQFAQLAAGLKVRLASVPSEGAEQQRLTALRALLKDIEAEREAERKQIVGVAQLILVNVMLPLLTALFGYIFGTGAAAQVQNPPAGRNDGNNLPRV